MSKEQEKKDILDDVKDLERKKKKLLLLKAITQLKDLCKDVKLIKKECEIILKEINVSDDDIKRIIDFVNSLPDTEVTEDDVKEIKDKVKGNLDNEKDEISETVLEKMKGRVDVDLTNNTLTIPSEEYHYDDTSAIWTAPKGTSFTLDQGSNDETQLVHRTDEKTNIVDLSSV